MRTKCTLHLIAAASLLVFVPLVLAGEGSINKAGPALARTFNASELKWNRIVSTIETPSDICRKVRHHMEYREDLGDEWATGKQAWLRGYGDCEDFAACVVELCRLIGVKAEIFIVYPRDSLEAHAVAVGRWKGQLWVSDNGWYETIESLNDITRRVARDLGWDRKTVELAHLSLADNTHHLVALDDTRSADIAASAPVIRPLLP